MQTEENFGKDPNNGLRKTSNSRKMKCNFAVKFLYAKAGATASTLHTNLARLMTAGIYRPGTESVADERLHIIGSMSVAQNGSNRGEEGPRDVGL
jgi:hypothetical protein